MTMRRNGMLWMAGVWLLASAAVAAAQSQSCLWEGKSYAEASTVCQAGLQQTCVNGTWQSLDGARCEAGGDQGEGEPTGDEVDPQGGFEPE